MSSSKIPDFFKPDATLHSTRLAISVQGVLLDHATLRSMSGTVARGLLTSVPGPSTPGRVALLLEQRAAAIAAMLGVLESGNAYVPLDPSDPETRIQHIFRDCAPMAIITDSANVDRARQLASPACAVINMDQLVQPTPTIDLPLVPPEALAYIFYTSGSTGVPKGVCQTRHNLLHFITNYTRALGLRADDRLSLLFSLSFGAASLDIYPALQTGAAICPYDMRKDGVPHLADWIDREQITILHIGPSAFRQLAKTLSPGRVFRSVRTVVLGGEALFSSDVELIRRHCPPTVRIINNFAATEAGVVAQFIVEPGEIPVPGRIPAGRCLDGVEVRIRWPNGQAADPGETGEIDIAGVGISPGYWQRDELNAQSFATDPQRPGWRIYRSGDLGRIDDAGDLHFLGRQGTRIKLRGHTIDLAEVEAGLRLCEGVRDACVTASTPGDGQEANRLVAHVVAKHPGELDAKSLRRSLAQQLPPYMLPGQFVFLDALPITATGKIDRNALTAAGNTLPIQSSTYEEPRDDVEREIAAIYERLLNTSPVGREDDFFLSGGDSMSAVELQLELNSRLGYPLSTQELLNDASVEALANRIRDQRKTGTTTRHAMPVIVPIREQGTGPALFLVHGRHGLAPMSPRFRELTGEKQALYVFQARGLDGIHQPHSTIEAMAADYVAAIRPIQPKGPYFLAGLCAGGFIALEMARLLQSQHERVLPLLLIDPPVPRFTAEEASRRIRRYATAVRSLLKRKRVKIDLDDPVQHEAGLRVKQSLEQALVSYRPPAYSGPIYLLTSRERLSPKEWGDEPTRKRYFSGEVRMIKAGERHADALDVYSQSFVSGLSYAMRHIRQAAMDDELPLSEIHSAAPQTEEC